MKNEWDKIVKPMLIENREAILKALSNSSQWSIPTNLQKSILEQLKKKTDWATLLPTVTSEKKSALFYSPLLKKYFFWKKLSEIEDYLNKDKKKPSSSTEIHFHCLEECENTPHQIKITIAKLTFDSTGLANEIHCLSHKTYPKLFSALYQSPWRNNNDNSVSIIRISDQMIEQNLLLKTYFSDIKYQLIQQESSANRNDSLHFWETLAKQTYLEPSNFTEEEIQAALKDIEADFKKLRETPEIEFSDAIESMAQKGEGDADQIAYLKTIIRNQENGFASLLYLPVGSGKTFIMLMAMAHHYTHNKEKKPYLVIVPSHNVLESWENNIKRAKKKEQETQKYIFGKPLTASIDLKAGSNALEKKLEENIIVIPQQSLLSYFKKKIDVKFKNDNEKLERSEKKYFDFIEQFNGIVVDESQDSISSSTTTEAQRKGHPKKPQKPKTSFNSRDILLDLSSNMQKYFERKKLILAASATPWPNDLKQIENHFYFLAARLLKEKIFMQKFLFNSFSNLEKTLQRLDYKEADAFSEPASDEEKDCEQALLLEINKIKNTLSKWMKVIFDHLVIHPPKNSESFHIISKEFLFIDGKHFKDSPIKKPDNILQLIDEFYAQALGLNQTNLLTAKRNLNESISDNDIKKIFKLAANFSETTPNHIKPFLKIFNENPGKRIAIYIHQKIHQLFLYIYLYYFLSKKNQPIEIGLYHAATSVKQISFSATNLSTKNGLKLPLPNNPNIFLNKNAFNKCFDFSDYVTFLDSRFNEAGTKHIPTFNALHKLKKKRNNISTIEQLYRNIFSKFIRKNLLSEEEKSEIQKAIGVRFDEFIIFCWLLCEFEQASQNTHITLFKEGTEEEWMVRFSKFLPIQEKNTSVFEDFKKFTEIIDDDIGKRNDFELLGQSLCDDFIITVLYYLYKMQISQVFIFGEACISGTNIDAEVAILLSGAWTEGKLNQIEGRFGRNKNDQLNSGLPCVLYAPVVSGTAYEFIILKIYLLKSLYNDLVCQNLCLNKNPQEILLILYIIKNISTYYRNHDLMNADFDSLFKKLMNPPKGVNTYFDLSLKEKSLHLCPPEYLKKIETFQSRLVTMFPKEDCDEEKLEEIEKTSYSSPPKKIKTTNKALQPISLSEKNKKNQSGLFLEYCIEMKGLNPSFFKKTTQEAIRDIISLFIMEKCFSVITTWKKPDEETIIRIDSTSEKKETRFEKDRLHISKPIFLGNEIHLPENDMTIKKFEDLLEHYKQTDHREIRFENEIFTEIRCKSEVVSIAFQQEEKEIAEIFVYNENIQQKNKKLPRKISIKNNDYILSSYIIGGHVNGGSHFVCWREGKSCHYELDDLKSSIITHPGSLPIHEKALYYKYVRKDLFEKQIDICPKHFKNERNNCYLHAAYQFLENQRLIDALKEFTIPEVVLIEELYLPHEINLLSTNKNTFILIVPTRGESPDLKLENFMNMVSDALSEIERNTPDFQLVCLYAINDENEEELQRKKNEIKFKRAKNDTLFIPCFFLWKKKNEKNLPPIGHMRNFCLLQARKIWIFLKEKLNIAEENIHLISMDGDTQITAGCFSYYLIQKLSFDSPLILSCGYGLKQNQENEKIYEFYEKASNFSMHVYSKMTFQVEDQYKYFGYFSEPVIFLSPEVVSFIFMKCITSELNVIEKNPEKTPFGHYDLEGRNLIRYLSRENFIFSSVGPSKKEEERPILWNSKRFILNKPIRLDPSFSLLELSKVVTAMAQQPQHCFKPFLMGANIFSAFRHLISNAIPLDEDKKALNRIFTVRAHASYFYINNLIRYLGLGPSRCLQLSQWMRMVHCPGEEKEDLDLESCFGLAASAFRERVRHYFGAILNKKIPILYKKAFITWLLGCSEVLQKICKDCTDEKTNGQYNEMFFQVNYPKVAYLSSSREANQIEDEEVDEDSILDSEEYHKDDSIEEELSPVTRDQLMIEVETETTPLKEKIDFLTSEEKSSSETMFPTQMQLKIMLEEIVKPYISFYPKTSKIYQELSIPESILIGVNLQYYFLITQQQQEDTISTIVQKLEGAKILFRTAEKHIFISYYFLKNLTTGPELCQLQNTAILETLSKISKKHKSLTKTSAVTAKKRTGKPTTQSNTLESFFSSVHAKI